MKLLKNNICIAIAMLLFGSSVSFASNTQQKSSNDLEFIPGILYVKFKPVTGNRSQQLPAVNATLLKYNVSSITQPFFMGAAQQQDDNFSRWYKLILPVPTDIKKAIQDFQKDPTVEYAEPSYIYHVDSTYTPNDPMYSTMWNLNKVLADQAWTISKGDTSVIIGICDTGMDYLHEDLAANAYTNPGESGLDSLGRNKRTNGVDDDHNGYIDDWHGWDFVGPVATSLTPDNDPHPYNGNPHGTHVAGTASAVTNNGKGVSGLGFNCRLLATKHGTDQAGNNSVYLGYEGIIYLINNGAKVINCSWGGQGGWSQFGQDVITYSLQKNVLVIAAAGNGDAQGVGIDNGKLPHFPSCYDGIFSVGASGTNDTKAGFSNYGIPSIVKVFAPGVNILSTVPAGYDGTYSGTSMASPLVSGLAGLVRAKHPSWTAGQVMLQIAGTADPIDALNPTFSGKMGYGRINAYRALTETPPPAKPAIAIVSVTVNDSVGGNGNGILEPGESSKLICTIHNGWGDAKNLTATVSIPSMYNWAVTVKPGKGFSNFGSFPGISKIDSATRSNIANPFELSISADAIPMNIPYKITLTADNGFLYEYSSNIPIASKVLFVDDDDGKNNIEGYFANALQKLNVVYDTWDHSANGSPSAAYLKNYNVVIWGCEWTFPSLDSADCAAIGSYLDGGGKLFLSGQDIGWDMCDPGGSTVGSQYAVTNGASKTFYENYLKAKYVADDGGSPLIAGVAGDSIGDGITFSRYQPGRATSEQFGDVMDPINGSQSVFVVNGGTAYKNRTTAIRYNGKYKLVHFGFGGFESITDSVARVKVMDRVLTWLSGYTVASAPLTDNENTTSPYVVSTTIKGPGTISANLFWSTTGVFPFTKTAMTAMGAGVYQASIPAQLLNTTVSYFVLVNAGSQYLPFQINSFIVSADTSSPQFVVADTIQNSIKLRGPYTIYSTITDRTGLDSTTLAIKYSVNGGSEQTGSIIKSSTPNMYQATINAASNLVVGNVVSYYLTVKDKSNAKNVGRYPATGTRRFVIGQETIDNFDNPTLIPQKWNVGGWGVDNTTHQSGLYSFTDSPDGLYSPNTDNALVLKSGYDLTGYSTVQFNYYRKLYIDLSDTLYVEYSRDSVNWVVLRKHNGADDPFTGMTKESIALNGFSGAGNQNVRFRFRLKTDGSKEADGAYIDDVELLVNGLTIAPISNVDLMPREYSLSQNFSNPFNPATTIQYGLPQDSRVRITVYNILGQIVTELVDHVQSAGWHSIMWHANVSSGLYLYKIDAISSSDERQRFTQVKKMVLMK